MREHEVDLLLRLQEQIAKLQGVETYEVPPIRSLIRGLIYALPDASEIPAVALEYLNDQNTWTPEGLEAVTQAYPDVDTSTSRSSWFHQSEIADLIQMRMHNGAQRRAVALAPSDIVQPELHADRP